MFIILRFWVKYLLSYGLEALTLSGFWLWLPVYFTFVTLLWFHCCESHPLNNPQQLTLNLVLQHWNAYNGRSWLVGRGLCWNGFVWSWGNCCLRSLIDDFSQLDVVVADLDGGSILLPENVHISLMPEPMLSRMLKSLQLVSVHNCSSLWIQLNSSWLHIFL